MNYTDIKGLHLSFLSLGTVQLGLDYGISNASGKPDLSTAFAILDKALERGINSLDTARGYGNSESVIGEWLKGVPAGKKADEVKRVSELLKITDVSSKLIKNLSKGYKQRVGLAQALIGNPPVLILDEPTVGLDPQQILEIRTLIKKLGKNHTVILSSHILSEIQAVCDRIIIINHGIIAAHDTTENLSKNISNDHRLIARIEGPREEIIKALRNINGIKYCRADMEREPGAYEYELEAAPGSDIRRDLFRIVAENNWVLLSSRSAEMTLEDMFLKITMGEGIVIENPEDKAKQKGEQA